MIMRRLAAVGAIATLLTTGLYVQAASPPAAQAAAKRRSATRQAATPRFKIDYVQTPQSKNDWEEINFEFNSAIISDGFPTLLWLSDYLRDHPDYHVKITGHTDYVGSRPYNEALGRARAQAVANFLKKYGARDSQIAVESEGKSQPEVENRTKEQRFVNRRVTLMVTDPQGRSTSLEDLIKSTLKPQAAEMPCCQEILKRLDKLDDILAELKRMKGEHDALEAKVKDLENQLASQPKPLTKDETTEIVKNEGGQIANKALDEAARRNKKFSLLGLNVGPTYGAGRTGDFTVSGRGQFFSPFGGSGTHAVQAQGEYMYYPGRQEGQFDIGLVNRWNNIQAGLFSSFKYLSFREYQNGGGLAQGAFTLDYLFGRGRVGIFGTKGFKNTAVLNRATLGPNSFLETYARIVDQVGGSAQVGLWGSDYVEGNLGYLKRHGLGSDRPGGMLRYVHPLNDSFALTVEAGLNETLLNTKDSGRLVFGFQFGNFLRPKEYLNTKSPVPVDVPRIRYELLTRRVGNSPPVADAGPDQIGIKPGTITLDGSGSYDPEGDALTYTWTQLAGPSVALSGANTAKATFTAAAGQSYSFRLTVKDTGGMQSSASVTVSTTAGANFRILTFAAAPTTVRPGQAATLAWVVEGASQVSIDPGIGSVDAKSGKTEVTPTQTTQYTLTATDSNGQAIHQTVTVTVAGTAPRIVQFAATPTSIMSGESATLIWSTDGAATVQIDGIGTVPASGSQAVSPTQTTTYTLHAIGSDGNEVSAPVVVTVSQGQVQVLTFSASPETSPSAGSPVTLSWTTSDATSVIITGTGAPSGSLPANGSVVVKPITNTTYTLTAYGPGGPVTSVISVFVR